MTKARTHSPRLILLFLALALSTACNHHPKYHFSYSNPETRGFSSQKLETLKSHLVQSGASSMMILVDGEVIFDWGESNRKLTVHSMRKCILNSLFGIAVSRGIIDTSMTLGELGIEDIEPGLSDQELSARVADLLKSRSGVYHPAAAVSVGMLQNMPERNSLLPGTHFYYNNWDFNVLGAILEQETGKSIYELFLDQIALPLGMQDYKGKYCSIDGEAEDLAIPKKDGFYQYETSKSRYPAYHFRLSARDLALYGQLYLNKGKWNGMQIVPASWIEDSTRPCSLYNQDYGIAYGMLWYVRIPAGKRQSSSFYHTGLGIHMLAVYPSLGMVLVHRVDTENNASYQKGDLNNTIELVFDSFVTPN